MKVKFIEKNVGDSQVRWGSHEDPKNLLEYGKEYELECAEVHSWHTKIFLKDFPGKSFNSVWFTWSENDDIWELTGARESWESRYH